MSAAEPLPRPGSALIRASIVAALLGVLACLPLLFKETPYTFVLFMFVTQPLLIVGFLLYVVKVFGDLRAGRLL